MISLSPIDLVILLAEATEGAGETPPGSNDGPFVRLCQLATGNKAGDAWCASWVTRIGKLALGKRWPVLASGRVQTISDWARTKGVRFLPTVGAQRGDLLLVWFGGKFQRHAHIAIVVEVHEDGAVTTIDGNTTLPGDDDPKRAREGWVVGRKRRVMQPKDRLVRWAPLVTNEA